MCPILISLNSHSAATVIIKMDLTEKPVLRLYPLETDETKLAAMQKAKDQLAARLTNKPKVELTAAGIEAKEYQAIERRQQLFADYLDGVRVHNEKTQKTKGEYQ